MAVKNITINFDINKQIKRLIGSKAGLTLIGETLKKEVLTSVSKGISPISGLGRFQGYKVDRASDTANPNYYPNNVRKKYPGKRKRPVNLKLTGEYLDTIGYNIKGVRLDFGFFNLDKKNYEKYKTHNLGLNKDVPVRKVIPTKNNESFTPGIVNSIKKVFNKFVFNELKKYKTR